MSPEQFDEFFHEIYMLTAFCHTARREVIPILQVMSATLDCCKDAIKEDRDEVNDCLEFNKQKIRRILNGNYKIEIY